ncbi:uncharacterized protein A1O9_12175 [Exophiala aquamarina CBS 119918]|uniref:Xylanolytic transcriptional activator regulatory domain-containing protein n=1 Tax=Exophiala aquamarina CBS 119918 TaxID=1182545 RepID=A0A072NXU7_9EURO|nr:uncharacterized protein A1O9_12175 [Exophiala aquamarina CBS 119918]KEF51838.1 hypothetical protein A1O9_12175 [Exophiala aquamarina CBS 119918]
MEAVAQLLSGPLLPNVDDLSDDPNATAAFHLLRRAVDAFFAHFCAVLPIVHVPTWDILSTSTALIAAMACIGSIFVDSSDAWENSLLLSEICSYVIVWQGESDAASYQDASYLSACCLHQIYSLGSGKRSLYQSADRKRGLLIGSLRGIGLLRSRLCIENDEPDQHHIEEARAEGLQARWLRWRDVQQGRRLAWASFEYDCSLCTLTNRRGAVDMSELPTHLPCTDALWQASSAAAWKALFSQSSQTARGPPQASLLRELLSAGTFPWDLPSWSKRLCSQIIGRLLWDIKQMELVWIYDYLGLSSLRAAQKQTSASLLNALSHLARSMTRASTTPELIDNNISRLIYHYSHLYTAGDILDLVIFIVRSSATTSTPNIANRQLPQKNAECHLAKSQLTSKLAYDRCKTRKLVWHAAQIIAVADEYVVSAPCEILRVSMGYLFIMAFARFGTHTQETVDMQEVESVKLDNLRPTPTQQEAMSRWIEHGGSASLASIDNLCSDRCIGALNEQAQALLSKLCNWGLVDKFSKILDAFQSCED